MTAIKHYIKALIPKPIEIRFRQLKEAGALRTWTEQDAARLLLYQDFVTKDDLVFDVGANLGNRTKVFHRLGTKVIAIEPQPRCWKVLKSAYAKESSVEIVGKAIGSNPGEAKMQISDAHYLSSISTEWISNVSDSGRFGKVKWNQAITVPVITLDELVQIYGRPKFVKIDVEGYEYEVIKGLSQSVGALSFEFASEALPSLLRCIQYLHKLGMTEFNFVEGESTRLLFEKWKSQEEILWILSSYQDNTSMFGDVYARCPSPYG